MDIQYLILGLFAVLNIIAFAVVGADKKLSIQNDQRIKEVNIFLWAIFFGSIGVFVGMLFFRHKTKKLSFIVGIALLILQQIILIKLLLETLFK